MMYYKKIPLVVTIFASSMLLLPAFSGGTKDTDSEVPFETVEKNQPARRGEGGGSGPLYGFPEDIHIPPEYIGDPSAPLLPEDAITLGGKLKVKGKGEKATFSLKADDKKTYTLAVPQEKKVALQSLKGKSVILQGTLTGDTFFVFTYAERLSQ